MEARPLWPGFFLVGRSWVGMQAPAGRPQSGPPRRHCSKIAGRTVKSGAHRLEWSVRVVRDRRPSVCGWTTTLKRARWFIAPAGLEAVGRKPEDGALYGATGHG